MSTYVSAGCCEAAVVKAAAAGSLITFCHLMSRCTKPAVGRR